MGRTNTSSKPKIKIKHLGKYNRGADDFYVSEESTSYGNKKPYSVFYENQEPLVRLLKGDTIEILNQSRENSVDMIFADPPYFLSNGGISCHAGKMVSVNKGKWDKSKGVEENHKFNLEWLKACQRVLKPNGTIWVSGTQHVIFSVGYAMQELGFKILNDITWEKPNPPPNLSCRYFTHSTETVLWAGKNAKSKHLFNYALMREFNGGKQMKTVWKFTSPSSNEKTFGKHPTQKPVELLQRIIQASTKMGDLVLDPFCGSSTTGVASILLDRKYVGIDFEEDYLDLSVKRLKKTVAEKESRLFPTTSIASIKASE
ncbi:MAG: site-specific DNA-methyltransferase [Nitrospinae bacterium]|nr:site-specific DNA-methyltransferase [Nitrospinota bacterium]